MEEKYCKTYKTSLSSFYKTGMLGCPDCYKEFEKEIIAAADKIQGGVNHVGKIPSISDEDKELLAEYARFKKEAEYYKDSADMEKVKEVKEIILDLETELVNRGLI